jgi:acyl-CoA synthetase (AMP-forming)/AMP-acid ligase II
MLLIERFEDVARKHPDRDFVDFIGMQEKPSRRISYGKANIASSQRARLLAGLGITRGDTIAILQPNSIDWVLWYLASMKLGVTAAALNTESVEEELVDLVDQSGAKVLVADEPRADVASAISRRRPKLSAVLTPQQVTGTRGIDDMLATVPTDVLTHSRENSLDDVLAIIFSSGTTGARPKAVQVSNRQMVVGNGAYLESVPMSAADRILLVTPIFHSCTLSWGLTLTILSGATAVLAERFSASRFWDQVEQWKPSILWTMGSIVHILLQHPISQIERQAAARLRVIFAAGLGNRAKVVAERWQHAIVVDGYGLTESPGTTAFSDCFEHNEPYHCIGRPVSSVEMRIINPVTGAQCKTREHGEIVLSRNNGFRGYLNNPTAMAEVIKDDGFHTGDIAYMDESGRFFFVDRMKDIIRRGDKNISAGEIEQCLMRHPDIAEVAAVPRPDNVLGERIAVFILPKNSIVRLSREDVTGFCKGRLAVYKIPEFVRIVAAEELPRTPTGKIAKFRLKQIMREEAARDSSAA